MAWHGGRTLGTEQTPTYLLLYWGVFLLFLLLAMYMVLLDIRYIRMQYLMGRREIYHGTLADEEFRRELIARLERAKSKAGGEETPAGEA